MKMRKEVGVNTRANSKQTGESNEAGSQSPELFDVDTSTIQNDQSNKPSVEPNIGSEEVASNTAESRHSDQELFIPIHGFVWMSDEEIAVLNHPAVQRLGNIMQLGFANTVYRGATHRRLEHSIGCVAIAAKIIRAVEKNHERLARSSSKQTATDGICNPLSVAEQAFVRLAALTHDIGHLAAGHTLEDELGLLNKHDSLKRLNMLLDKAEWYGISVPPLRGIIDSNYGKYCPTSSNVKPSEILLSVIAKMDTDDSTGGDAAMEKRLKEKARFVIRVDVCRDIVGNTICADLLDYLQRDWYHLGKPKHFETRLFQYMEIRKDRIGNDAFVISLGDSPNLRTDAVSVMLDLLESRYQMCESVLFHRSKCSASACLERSILELSEDTKAKSKSEPHPLSAEILERELLEMSDLEMLKYLLVLARGRKVGAAIRPLESLLLRSVYKEIRTEFGDQFRGKQKSDIQTIYTDAKKPTNRLNAMRFLEQDFDLPAGSLAMYCPHKKMNAKIPGVKICYDGDFYTFQDLETPNNAARGRFSSGHVQAQLERFDGLWRVHVYLDKNVYATLDRKVLKALKRAIKVCVFGIADPDETLAEAVEDLASSLSHIPGTRYYRQDIGSPVGHQGEPIAAYPSGAPTLRSHIQVQ